MLSVLIGLHSVLMGKIVLDINAIKKFIFFLTFCKFLAVMSFKFVEEQSLEGVGVVGAAAGAPAAPPLLIVVRGAASKNSEPGRPCPQRHAHTNSASRAKPRTRTSFMW